MKVNKISLLWKRIEDKICITRYNNVVDKIYIEDYYNPRKEEQKKEK